MFEEWRLTYNRAFESGKCHYWSNVNNETFERGSTISSQTDLRNHGLCEILAFAVRANLNRSYGLLLAVIL